MAKPAATCAHFEGPNVQPEYVRDQSGKYCFTKPVSGNQILALASKVVAEKYQPGLRILSDEQACEYLLHRLNYYGREVFGCLWLNSKHSILGFDILFAGTIDRSSVYPREVVKSGLGYNAAAVVVCHNHPSGNPTPSTADKTITVKLKAALELVGIRLLDHIVVGGSEARSMAKLGMI